MKIPPRESTASLAPSTVGCKPLSVISFDNFGREKARGASSAAPVPRRMSGAVGWGDAALPAPGEGRVEESPPAFAGCRGWAASEGVSAGQGGDILHQERESFRRAGGISCTKRESFRRVPGGILHQERTSAGHWGDTLHQESRLSRVPGDALQEGTSAGLPGGCPARKLLSRAPGGYPASETASAARRKVPKRMRESLTLPGAVW